MQTHHWWFYLQFSSTMTILDSPRIADGNRILEPFDRTKNLLVELWIGPCKQQQKMLGRTTQLYCFRKFSSPSDLSFLEVIKKDAIWPPRMQSFPLNFLLDKNERKFLPENILNYSRGKKLHRREERIAFMWLCEVMWSSFVGITIMMNVFGNKKNAQWIWWVSRDTRVINAL